MTLKLYCLVLIGVVFISGCKADVCPPGSVTYVSDTASLPDLATVLDSVPSGGPFAVQIGRKIIQADRVIEGSLCNDRWSGTVYVGCNLQVAAWIEEEGSNFLEDCDLVIEPGTVVYVAAHNNAAYYKGCAACHGGAEETPTP